MANWIINSSDRYFAALVERMKQELLKLPVTQSDETPTQVIHDDRSPGSKVICGYTDPLNFSKNVRLLSTNTKKAEIMNCLLRFIGIITECL